MSDVLRNSNIINITSLAHKILVCQNSENFFFSLKDNYIITPAQLMLINFQIIKRYCNNSRASCDTDELKALSLRIASRHHTDSFMNKDNERREQLCGLPTMKHPFCGPLLIK